MEPNLSNLPKLLIAAGVLLIVTGLVFWALQGRLNGLYWLGRLPGDIRIERENFRFYAPITTMILLSIVLTLLVRVFQRFFQ